ncbi:serine/threonine protein kinase [Rhodoferax sp.]|uniref:serine/threonine protein kinase n=1 Tax=Rhodoferax sp. TaxID=50421 RepID=UPI001EC29F40|nr:serine/threonine protein kinase [Rhodoferax sp.]MBT9506908.1 HDOD domain-containing protein [Rhodoferax sp.]
MVDFSPLSTIKRMANGQPSQSQTQMLGRFELRRVLGQGAQSIVWLAFDPRLEREVAIKQMKLGKGSDASAIAQWLQEARSVSRLTHPNIVPVFEADVHEQQPYLVFEYVPGQTLAAVLGKRGALPAHEAVPMMMDVLNALITAHAAGVVHRDLKPSNVLIDEAGRARVMDFGIAAQVQSAPSAGKSDRPAPDGGTPGYMSPEAAEGTAATPLMDVFSAGIVLAEMLTGKPLINERDPYRAIYRVVHEQLELPKDLRSDVDDKLRSIASRALARDPSQRHASAKVFHDELAGWAGAMSKPQEEDGEGASASNGNSTLDFLLRRMRHKSDFPAMSDSVVRIQGMATSETESVGSVTNEILKDVALTNKLLRLVNSAHYSRGSSISTVSRAVSLVGFNGIRNMALSLVLLEHMQDKAHANVLKEEFLRSLMAGSIGSELCPVVRESEEAFIGSMFQNLGRLLAEYYFPEEARTVRGLTASARQPVSEATASAGVLGLSYQALGMGVAKAWGLPEGIQRCMKKPDGAPPARAPEETSERLRWIAAAANEIADILLHADPKDVTARVAQVAKNYAKTMGVSVAAVQLATTAARTKLIELAKAMDLKVSPGSAASKLLNDPDEDQTGVRGNQGQDPPDTLVPHELHATQTAPPEAGAVTPRDVKHVAEILAAGIQDITNAMVEDFKLTDVLRMILETMFRAMEFQRIIFCMRDPKIEALTGRFGLGEGVERVVKSFSVTLKGSTPDLFTAVCTKGADTMISDATEPRIADRLPVWYRKSINAPTFLLLPLIIKGKPFGLIYADKGEKGGLILDEKELALLRTLRNQAVMAFKQSS